MVVKCTECGVSCDNCQLLLRHHRYHHGEKIRCEYCSYVVSRNVIYRMKDHYRRRHAGKEFQQVGQEKTSLSKSPYQRSPSWRGLKYRDDKIMEATQSSRVHTPKRCPLAAVDSTPLTHLRSPSLIYLGEFPTSPARVSVVHPAMSNLFKTPVKMQPTGIEAPSPFTVTSSGEGDALPKPSSEKPVLPYESSNDPEKLYNLPPYNPTQMQLAQQSFSPPRRVELLRPVPIYLGNVEMPRQGVLYEYTNRLSSLHYADTSEAFAGYPSICSKHLQAECLRQLRMKAKSFGQFFNSHHSDLAPHEWLKRVEKAVIPNGTVNMLTSMRFRDPTVSKMESQCTMTEDERPLTRHIETQTEESSPSIVLSARITEEKETQCSIFSLNLN